MPPRPLLKVGAIPFTPPAPAHLSPLAGRVSGQTPRFVWFHRRIQRTKSDILRFYVAVIELKPGKFIFSTDPRRVKRVLYKSPVIRMRATPAMNNQGKLVWHDDELREVMERAERVTKAMNQMRLAVEAWETEENGIQLLFDRLWAEEDNQPTELNHGTTEESQTH